MPRVPSILLLLLTTTSSFGVTPDEFKELLAKVVAQSEQRAAELAKFPAPLPSPAAEPDRIPPPTHLRSAPPVFMEAWKELGRFNATMPKAVPPEPATPRLAANNHGRSSFFVMFLEDLLAEDDPPSLAEAYRFYYQQSPSGECATGVDTSPLDAAVTLCHLRNNDVPGAFHPALAYRHPDIHADLLTHLGFDADLVRLGSWASLPRWGSSQGDPLKGLCRHSSDRIANAMIDWHLIHQRPEPDGKVATRAPEEGENEKNFPRLPTYHLAWMLGPRSGLSDVGRRRVSKFILDHGEGLEPSGLWLMSTPEGGEQWMTDFARKALHSPSNETRKRAIRLLERAGASFKVPRLDEPPLFDLSINGQRWPGDLKTVPRLRIQLRSANASWGPSLIPTATGSNIYQADPDHFTREGRLLDGFIRHRPSSLFKPYADPAEPWINHQIPVPPAFGETTAVEITTQSLTISPQYSADHPQNPLVENHVSLWWSCWGERPAGRSTSYQFRQGEDLILSHLSPGSYRYVLTSPGSKAEESKLIQVADKPLTITPKLQRGTAVIVPVSLEMENIPKASEQHLRALLRQSARPVALTLGGAPVKFISVPPAGYKKQGPHEIIFAGLGPGDYTISIRPFDLLIGVSREEWIVANLQGGSLEFTVGPLSGPIERTSPLTLRFVGERRR